MKVFMIMMFMFLMSVVLFYIFKKHMQMGHFDIKTKPKVKVHTTPNSMRTPSVTR